MFEEGVGRLDCGIPAVSDPEGLATTANLVTTGPEGAAEVVEAGRFQGGEADIRGLYVFAGPLSHGNLVVPRDDLSEDGLPWHIAITRLSNLHCTEASRMLEQREQPLRRGPPAGKIARRLSAAVDEALELVVGSHVVIPSLPALSLLSIWPCRLFSIGMAVATPQRRCCGFAGPQSVAPSRAPAGLEVSVGTGCHHRRARLSVPTGQLAGRPDPSGGTSRTEVPGLFMRSLLFPVPAGVGAG